MRRKLLILATVVLVALSGSVLSASPILDVHDYNFGLPAPGKNVAFNQPVTFQLFDSNLGTLLSVQVDVWSHYTARLRASNGDDFEHELTGLWGNSTTNLTAFSGVINFNTVSPTVYAPVSVGSPVTLGVIPDASYRYTYTATTAVNGHQAYTTSSSLGSWQAAGGGFSGTPFTIGVTSSATGISDGGIDVAYSAGGTEYGEIRITYSYETGVPEPVTMALVGSSLVGLGWFSARRRQRKS